MSGDSELLGLLSVAISSIALVGVAYSLVLQANGLRLARAQATRSTQIELIRMLIENPTIESPFGGADPASRTVELHLNLMMKHHEFGFLVGDFSENAIRTQMSFVFSSPVGREFWLRVRSIYASEANSKNKRRFVEILDEELRGQLPADSRHKVT
jgi:hypothetical protein